MTILEDLQIFLNEEIAANHEMSAEQIMKLIDKFDDQQKKKYLDQRKDGKITFGKYNGYAPKELALTDKGRSYLAWLLTQTWFSEKNSHLVEEIKSLGIKKQVTKRVPLD